MAWWSGLGGLAGLMILVAPVAAKDPAHRAPQLQKLVDCKGLTDPTARLACYDREVDALDVAERQNDVVVVDKQQIHQAKRSLFGLTLPNLDIFAGKGNSEVISQIEDKVAAARQTGDGWRVTLGDGSSWQQTDGRSLFRDPRPGDPVTVKRGVLGSYFMMVGKIPGFKVRRVI